MQCIIDLSDLLSVTAPDGQDITPIGARSKALIALLVLSPRGACSRAVLQDRLWSTRAPEQGRASLRQELARLRRHFRKFGVEPLEVEGDLVRLSAAAVRLRLHDRGLQPTVSGFLENVDVKDPEFETWLATVRQAWVDNKVSGFLCADLVETPPEAKLPSILPPGPALGRAPRIVVGDIDCTTEGIIPGAMRSLFRDALSARLREAGFDIFHKQPALGEHGHCLSAVCYLRQGFEAIFTLKTGPEQRISWCRTYSLSLPPGAGDLLDLCDEVAMAIITFVFTATWSRLADWRGVSPEIRQEYMQGRCLEFSSNKDLKCNARHYFKKCLAFDPEFQPAHVALGFCEIDRLRFGESNSSQQSLEIIHRHFANAVALDSGDFWTQCLGSYLAFFTDPDGAGIVQLRRAVDDVPYDPEKLAYLATLMGHKGDLHAQLELHDAIDCSSHEQPGWVARGQTYASVLVEAPDAEARVRRAIEKEGPNEANMMSLLLFLIRSGQRDRSRDCAEQMRLRFPRLDVRQWAFRYRHGSPALHAALIDDFARLGL